MAKIDVSDSNALKAAVGKYLDEYQGELVCALQLWYQGLGGQGVPNPGQVERSRTLSQIRPAGPTSATCVTRGLACKRPLNAPPGLRQLTPREI